MQTKKTLRLILGDQLNSQHSWFKTVDAKVTFVLMEIRTETDYATHHIQKIVGFFAAMQNFAQELIQKKHNVIYISLNDKNNQQCFDKNIIHLFNEHNFNCFEYQLPDEYRVNELLFNFCNTLSIPNNVFDTEHFLSTRLELEEFFKGKKTFLMESFYRYMRKKHNVLMQGAEPLTGQWNYDKDNRKKIPASHKCTTPLVFDNDVTEVLNQINKTSIQSIGSINAKQFVWPINRNQFIQLLAFFVEECLPLFGTYQDAMTPNEWSL